MVKRWVFNWDLNAVIVGVCRRERGSLFHDEGPAAEKDREPTVDRFVRGIRRRQVSEVERSVRDGE